jgi:hypothetical protein
MLAYGVQRSISTTATTATLAVVCGLASGIVMLIPALFLCAPHLAGAVLQHKVTITRAKLILVIFLLFIFSTYIFYKNGLMPTGKEVDFMLLLAPILGCACASGLVSIYWYSCSKKTLLKYTIPSESTDDRPGIPEFGIIFAAIGFAAMFLGTTAMEYSSPFIILPIFAFIFYLVYTTLEFLYTTIRLALKHRIAIPPLTWFLLLAAILVGGITGWITPQPNLLPYSLIAATLGVSLLAAFVIAIRSTEDEQYTTNLKAFFFLMIFFDILLWVLGTCMLPAKDRWFGADQDTPLPWLIFGLAALITTAILLIRMILYWSQKKRYGT